MDETTRVQGREITKDDIELVRRLIEANPWWNRTRLSRELCLLWDWRSASGQLKDMACRSLLSKLARLSYITLPAGHPYGGRHPPFIPDIPHRTDPVSCPLSRLTPLRLEVVEGDPLLPLFKCLLSRYHYLGFQGNVGENLKYMVFDREQNPLACLLFGSASWKNAPRDDFIGWDAAARETNLYLVTANMRFLVLPWVRVPHLASHILGMVVRDISKEWVKKYGHPIHLVETFVERGRFQGICYQAANWVLVGQTRGRSRNDRARTLRVPIKDVYLYPVTRGFRDILCWRQGDGMLLR